MSDEIVKAIGALREAADNKEQVSVKKFEEIRISIYLKIDCKVLSAPSKKYKNHSSIMFNTRCNPIMSNI